MKISGSRSRHTIILAAVLAVLFGAADEEQAQSVMERAYTTAHGIPCVWPVFPPYHQTGYGRHCGTVWPHIQGFWALAALKTGRIDLFLNELRALSAHALRDGQFAEIYHPEDGRIYGGIQEGGGKYLEWRSCAAQSWSAAALLAMVLYGVCGLPLEDLPSPPGLPEPLRSAALTGLPANPLQQGASV